MAQNIAWKHSIQTKIGVWLFVILTGVLAIYGVYQYMQIKRDATQDLMAFAEQSIVRLAEQLRLPLWEADPTMIGMTIASEMGDRRIAAVFVEEVAFEGATDDERQHLMRQGKIRNDKWEIVDTGEPPEEDGLLIRRAEIHYQDELLGKVTVYLTPKFIAEALNASITQIFETVGVLSIVLVVCLLVLMKRIVIQAITRIVYIVNRVAVGDTEVQVTSRYLSKRDEIGMLAQAIKELIDVTNETARMAEEIANGNLNLNVQERSENDRLMRALQQMIGSLKDVAAVAQAVAVGNVEIEVKVRSEQDILMQALSKLVDSANEMTNMAERIADGDLSLDVQARSDCDRLVQALNHMIQSLQAVEHVAEAMAEGNLAIDVQIRSAQDGLMQALSKMVTQLNRIVLDVKAMSEQVASNGRQMSATSEELSQATTQQAAAAEEASSSMEQMAANIRQNSDNARQTEKIALQSAEDARRGDQAVTNTMAAMKEIEARISVIQEIAMQTNILSMNATIEAVKAQDYGKGFGVVASEVRSLAQRSREAADQIEQLVRSCVAISEQAGEVLQRLVPNSEKTAELVQEIAAASTEQSLGAEQINKAIQQLDTTIQQNAATADEMAASAEELSVQADQLNTVMEFFTVRETAQIEPDISPDILGAVQTFMNLPQDNEEALAALIKTVMAAKTRRCASQTNIPSLPLSPPAKEPKHASGRRYTLKDKEEISDNLDTDEFEHY